MATTSEQLKRIGRWVDSKLNLLEIVLLSLFIFIIILQFFIDDPLKVILIFVLLGLGVLYFFSAFHDVRTEQPNRLDAFFRKMAGFASSLIIIGITFRIMHWPAYDIGILMGVIVLIVTAFYMIIRINKNLGNPYFSSRWIARLIVLILAGGFFYIAKGDILTTIGF